MKEEIVDFVEGVKDDIGVEEWIVDACNLLEKLNLSVGVDLNGADVEAQLGSEPDVEVERGEFGGIGDEIPELTDGTESCSSDEDCVNFKGGMMDGRIINYTDDVMFKVKQRCYWDDEEVVWRTMRDMALCDQAEEDEVPHIDTSGEWVQEVELSGRKDVWSSTEDIASGGWKQDVALMEKDVVWSSTEDFENGLKLEDVVSFERDVVMIDSDTDEDSSRIDEGKSVVG